MAASMSVFRNATSKAFKHESTPFEQEQDANSALSDLDRGKYSPKWRNQTFDPVFCSIANCSTIDMIE